MPYVINRWAGTPIVTVEDGTVTQTLDVKLIGKNYAGYGEIQNENFVHLLENFAGSQSPVNALSGQIWYDTLNKKLKFHTGDQIAGVKLWKTAGGVEYGPEPANPVQGDLWFDSTANQLKIRKTTGWSVIGPQSAGAGVTQMTSRTILGWPIGVNQATTPALAYSLITATINDEVVYIVSKDDFVIFIDATDATSNIPGFNQANSRILRKGLNLPYTDANGKSSTTHQYWGTAALSKGLLKSDGSILNADTIFSGNNVDFGAANSAANFGDIGFRVGQGQDFSLFIEAGTKPILQNLLSDTLTFRINDGSTTSSIEIKGKSLNPQVDNAYTLGQPSLKWSTVHAATFSGRATSAASLFLSAATTVDNLVTPAVTDTAWTVAVRDQNKAITATLFNGDALRARYADLAEKYLTDREYPAGTVVAVGGPAEVRACNHGDRAVGAVSANPAYMMNSGLEGGTYIALKGRVPVKIFGPVKQGDRLVAANDGCARVSAADEHHNVFAVALATVDNLGINTVEALIL